MKRLFVLLIACLIMVGCVGANDPKPIPKFAVGDVLCMEGMTFRMKVSTIRFGAIFDGVREPVYVGISNLGEKSTYVREKILIPCPQPQEAQ